MPRLRSGALRTKPGREEGRETPSTPSCQGGSQPRGSQSCWDTPTRTSGHPPPLSPPARGKNLPLLRAVQKSGPIFFKANREEAWKKGKRRRADLKPSLALLHAPPAELCGADAPRGQTLSEALPRSPCLKCSCNGFSSCRRVKRFSSSLLTLLPHITKRRLLEISRPVPRSLSDPSPSHSCSAS